MSNENNDNSLLTIIKKTNIIALSGLVAFFLLYLNHALVFIAFPEQVDYGEGYVLNSANMLANGVNIYPAITSISTFYSVYPPVYYLICAAFIKIFGLSLSSGRLISVISGLLSAYLIYAILKTKTRRPILSVTTAIIFLISPCVFSWSVLTRVDMLALAFSLTGIYLMSDGSKKYGTYLSIFFFVLAFYTKQSYFIAPLTVFLSRLCQKRATAIKFLSIYLISIFSIFLFLNYITAGQFYIQVMKNNFLHNFSLILWMGLLIDTLSYYIYNILIISSASSLIISFAERRFSLFNTYFLMTALCTALLIGKSGSASNYLIEVTAASCLLLGFTLDDLTKNIRKGINHQTIFLYLIIGGVFFSSIGYIPFSLNNQDLKNGAEEHQKLSDIVINTKGPILSEDAGLMVLNNKSGDVFEFFLFSSLARAGQWNQTDFVGRIENQKFEKIILFFNTSSQNPSSYKNDRFTDEMLSSIKASYILDSREKGIVREYYIYIPFKEPT